MHIYILTLCTYMYIYVHIDFIVKKEMYYMGTDDIRYVLDIYIMHFYINIIVSGYCKLLGYEKEIY